MGFVWAVRRSLRLLTLLTLMASTLCAGQSLAAQEIAAPRPTLSDNVSDPGSFRDLVVAPEIFQGESAVTVVSAINTIDTFGPAFSFTATLPTAPAAPAPLSHPFSPPAERAPPAA
ncbi:MAG TPA: hypothetical protein VFC19_03885 [Candidatus Limnocylindrales bacterium]|nr:hypothetical protein [Candidatus Limnocylindrales bacterium]